MSDDDRLPSIKPTDFPSKDVKDIPTKGAKLGLTDKMRVATEAEQRFAVWDCYVNGITNYRMIEAKTGVSKSTCHRWIQGDIKRLASDRDDLAANFMEVELARLDTILELLMRDVGTKLIDVTKSSILSGGIQGDKVGNRKDTYLLERVDTDIVDRILKVQERRAKYLALDNPRQEKTRDNSDGFDLAELIDYAVTLSKGKMPQEFIDAEFTEKETNEEGKEKDKAEEPQGSEGGREETQVNEADQRETEEQHEDGS